MGASGPGRFTQAEKPGACLTEGWIGSRTDGSSGEEMNCLTLLHRNNSSAVQSVAESLYR
jgi:hypothetical protein